MSLLQIKKVTQFIKNMISEDCGYVINQCPKILRYSTDQCKATIDELQTSLLSLEGVPIYGHDESFSPLHSSKRQHKRTSWAKRSPKAQRVEVMRLKFTMADVLKFEPQLLLANPLSIRQSLTYLCGPSEPISLWWVRNKRFILSFFDHNSEADSPLSFKPLFLKLVTRQNLKKVWEKFQQDNPNEDVSDATNDHLLEMMMHLLEIKNTNSITKVN
ncbi:hypothetical protein RFI_32498 [Reticulomyxa filosa]|uniref:Uncharacterized protein n=1 Tax=Reticulomyxa filosa TaxID=46433 RepID=X6LSN6_RETFI|nr:hypothetical protein RFI_32498 [Reticulomyxa filosa]|eukprot:ETO04898.1 hypothetical protein RFI_32498 [Reticulomyxa filosa]